MPRLKGVRRVVVRAPAKVNLALQVLGRRDDGYHEIESVLLALGLEDRLEVELAESGEVTLALSGPARGGVPGDGDNLAARAALEVLDIARARAGPGTGLASRGLRLALTKAIPAAAGLGGGSSDAAAAVLGAAELLGLDPDDGELAARLSALGSDCPFFLAARDTGLARCSGRGERVEPLAAELPWTIALVTPAIECSTAEVYAAFPGVTSGGSDAPFDVQRFARVSLEEARAMLRNDLEHSALAVRPELGGFRALLEEVEPGGFRLAGSGSSFFALFSDGNAARAALGRLDVRAEARRYAVRGRWVVRPSGSGARLEPSSSHLS